MAKKSIIFSGIKTIEQLSSALEVAWTKLAIVDVLSVNTIDYHGAMTLTPTSAIIPLKIDQNYDNSGIVIDTESANYYGLLVNAKNGIYIQSDVSGGQAAIFYRNIAEAGSNPLVTIKEDHASSTQPVLSVVNDGAGYGTVIDQNGNQTALLIDCESTSHYALAITGKYGLDITQDISNGIGLSVSRNIAEAGSTALVTFLEDNAASTQTLLSLVNDGTGVGVLVDQNGDSSGINVDCEATTAGQIGIAVNAKYCEKLTQDISGGYGLFVYRNIAEAGSNALALFQEDHASGTQDVVSILNDGAGLGLVVNSSYVGGFNNSANFIHGGNSSNAGGILIQSGTNNDSGTNYAAYIADGDGTTVGFISHTSGTTTFGTSSDERLKENIRDTHYGLNDLMKLEVKDFNFIKYKVDTTGMIAQKTNEIYPECVSKPNDESKEYWGIDYGKLTPLLIKAVQELTEKVNKLEEKKNGTEN